MIDKDIVFKYVKFSLLGQDELQTLSVFITLVRSLWRKGLHLLSLLNQHLAADIILTVVSTQCAHHTFDLINSILVLYIDSCQPALKQFQVELFGLNIDYI